MRLSIVQTALHWENPAANRAMLEAKLAPLAGQTELVVLPEMFTTGFSMNAAALAEPLEGPTVQWMRAQATKLQAAVTGSFICAENGRFYNRLVWADPDGRLLHADKRHLFSLAEEHQTYTPGSEKRIIEWKGWRILPLVCYDLRFPVWSRYSPDAPFDLLLYVANWPERRGRHWRSLLPARAIENQAYVVGVNIFGMDGNGISYTGDSAIIDYAGQALESISGREGIGTAELSLEKQNAYRQQFPFLHDADAFSLR